VDAIVGWALWESFVLEKEWVPMCLRAKSCKTPGGAGAKNSRLV